jgi:hypothetical protein
LCQPQADFRADWPLAALVAIRSIREQHPGSLIFGGGADHAEFAGAFPLRIPPNTAVAHVVYTLSVASDGAPQLGALSALRPFLHSWPTFASMWSPGGVGLSPIADIEALQLEQTATGFAAWNWNSDPKLVVDAAGGDFAPTGRGSMVQRALSRPAIDRTAALGRR